MRSSLDTLRDRGVTTTELTDQLSGYVSATASAPAADGGTLARANIGVVVTTDPDDGSLILTVG